MACSKVGKTQLILLLFNKRPSFHKKIEKSEIFKAVKTTENIEEDLLKQLYSHTCMPAENCHNKKLLFEI